MATGSGTKDDPWILKTPPGTAVTPAIALFGKASANIEGTLRRFTPELSPFDVFRDAMGEILRDQIKQQASNEELLRIANEAFFATRSIPEQIRYLAQAFTNGQMVLRTPDDAEVVVHYAPPVVILRVRVMELPESEPRRGELFRQLLEYNARDLVHGSYGLEGDHVVLTDTLELENLDFSEFEASFESMTLALASHLGALATYRER